MMGMVCRAGRNTTTEAVGATVGGAGTSIPCIEAGAARDVTSQACLSALRRVISRRGWARSSAGEHCLDMAGVTGSIPVAPTIQTGDFNDYPV
jgi:hypothetical protein